MSVICPPKKEKKQSFLYCCCIHILCWNKMFSLGKNVAGLVFQAHGKAKVTIRLTRKCRGGVLFALTLLNCVV